jgi:hypothetical protein
MSTSRKTLFILAAVTALACVAPASAAQPAAQTGDQLLARAVAAPQLKSYSVPVHFAVHLHKPIGIRSNVEGTAYFRAPDQTALSITKASGIVGGFFKGAYHLDIVPQAWPVTYRVTSYSRIVSGGVPMLQLIAVPRANAGDLTQVVFSITAADFQPVAVVWSYSDKSSISVSYVNGRVGRYMVPQRASINVDKPRYKLDADATYGTYALNAPVPPGIFSAAK